MEGKIGWVPTWVKGEQKEEGLEKEINLQGNLNLHYNYS